MVGRHHGERRSRRSVRAPEYGFVIFLQAGAAAVRYVDQPCSGKFVERGAACDTGFARSRSSLRRKTGKGCADTAALAVCSRWFVVGSIDRESGTTLCDQSHVLSLLQNERLGRIDTAARFDADAARVD